jgi:ligand-binding SRPBCC domain-containing protein
MTTFEHTAQILRPPEEVFAFLADPANLPRWQPSLIAVRPHRNGPLRPGVEVTETRRFLGRVTETTWVCTEHAPSRRSVIESDEGPVPFRGIWELEAAGESTVFSWTLETGGLAARLARGVARRLACEELAADTLRLKELLEHNPA